ncbi:MAG TPA: helix-turn-helix transcriptional regulator [Anaerolineales bacterium]|nr:helix-turn-helix transcriptional regulator [Anaerolineales bacterium]
MREDQDASRPIYNGAFFRIGQFRRGSKHSNFGGPHQIGGTLVVFPRTSVTITHAGKDPVVADPNTVMFYNHGQIYSRDKLSDKGDLCEWFGFDPTLVADAIRSFDEHVDDHPCEPFAFSHGPSDTASYLWQRLVVDHILGAQQQLDHLFIEETVMQILNRVIENRYRQRAVYPFKTKVSQESEVVDAIQNVLAVRFEQNPSLEQIATQLNYSPFHLCRIFRKHTGQSIRQYLNQLRLRASLEYVTQANTDLTSLALEMGFASHSHFTEAFRKTFGTPPSGLRNISQRTLRQLWRKISIA